MSFIPYCEIPQCGWQSTCCCNCRQKPFYACNQHIEGHQTHPGLVFHINLSENQQQIFKEALQVMNQQFPKQTQQILLKKEYKIEALTIEMEKVNKTFAQKLRTLNHNFYHLQKIIGQCFSQKKLIGHSEDPFLSILINQKRKNSVLQLKDLMVLINQLILSKSSFSQNLNTSQLFTITMHQKGQELEILKKSKQKFYCDIKQALVTCMQLSQNQILITGGLNIQKEPVNTVQVLNLSDMSLKKFPTFSFKRYRHALAWIQNKPAIIGGMSSGQVIRKSVQIFQENKWKRGPSLVIARCDLSACSTQNCTFAIGGLCQKDLTSIERCQFGK